MILMSFPCRRCGSRMCVVNGTDGRRQRDGWLHCVRVINETDSSLGEQTPSTRRKACLHTAAVHETESLRVRSSRSCFLDTLPKVDRGKSGMISSRSGSLYF